MEYDESEICGPFIGSFQFSLNVWHKNHKKFIFASNQNQFFRYSAEAHAFEAQKGLKESLLKINPAESFLSERVYKSRKTLYIRDNLMLK